MPDESVTAEDLTTNIDLSRECASIAIISALALDASDTPVQVIQQAIELWPSQVSDHALVIGQRIVLALFYMLNLDANKVAQVAEHLSQPTTTTEVPTNDGQRQAGD